MTFPTLTRDQVLDHLTNEVGEPLVILPWWREAFAALDDPTKLELILRLIRQTGKSQLLAAIAQTELLCVPNSYTVLVAASEAQQQAIYARKIRRPLERLLKSLGLHGLAKFTKHGVEIPDLNSALEVLVSTEDTTPGRTVTKVLLDEARHVQDAVYTALAPSTIGSGGKVVIASSSGPPRGFFHALCTQPTEHTWLYESATNDNPRANRGVLDFIKRRLGLVSPAAAQRELGNLFADDGDSFLPGALIDRAVDETLHEQSYRASDRPAFAFLDLSRKRDLTSLVVVLQVSARELVAVNVQTWDPKDPKQSPTGEVDFEAVRGALEQVSTTYPGLRKVLVDEGAEAGSILPWARAHYRLSGRVEGFTASTTSNMDLWSALSARLHAGTLRIPRHDRLIAELKSLRQESFALGSRWRVVDSSRKLHRDVSVSLAGACYAAGETRTCTSPWCNDPTCDGQGPLLLFTPRWWAWKKQHPSPEDLVQRAEWERKQAETQQAPQAREQAPTKADREKDFLRWQREQQEAAAARRERERRQRDAEWMIKNVEAGRHFPWEWR